MDLKHFLPSDKAAAALKLLDADADGKISLHDMRDAVLHIYKASALCRLPPFSWPTTSCRADLLASNHKAIKYPWKQ